MYGQTNATPEFRSWPGLAILLAGTGLVSVSMTRSDHHRNPRADLLFELMITSTHQRQQGVAISPTSLEICLLATYWEVFCLLISNFCFVASAAWRHLGVVEAGIHSWSFWALEATSRSLGLNSFNHWTSLMPSSTRGEFDVALLLNQEPSLLDHELPTAQWSSRSVARRYLYAY